MHHYDEWERRLRADLERESERAIRATAARGGVDLEGADVIVTPAAVTLLPRGTTLYALVTRHYDAMRTDDRGARAILEGWGKWDSAAEDIRITTTITDHGATVRTHVWTARERVAHEARDGIAMPFRMLAVTAQYDEQETEE